MTCASKHFASSSIALVVIGLKQSKYKSKGVSPRQCYKLRCFTIPSRPGRFQPWPEDALLNVAQKFLTKLDELGAQEGISTFPLPVDIPCKIQLKLPARLKSQSVRVSFAQRVCLPGQPCKAGHC